MKSGVQTKTWTCARFGAKACAPPEALCGRGTPRCDALRRWGLWGQLGLPDVAGALPLQSHDRAGFLPALPALQRCTEKSAVCNPEKGAPPREPEQAGTLVSDSQPPGGTLATTREPSLNTSLSPSARDGLPLGVVRPLGSEECPPPPVTQKVIKGRAMESQRLPSLALLCHQREQNRFSLKLLCFQHFLARCTVMGKIRFCIRKLTWLGKIKSLRREKSRGSSDVAGIVCL